MKELTANQIKSEGQSNIIIHGIINQEITVLIIPKRTEESLRIPKNS